MSANRTIVVFGSGPGIGSHVAAQFASQGFTHIILLARNEKRLQEDKGAVVKANPDAKVDILTVDLEDIKSIPAVLKQIDNLTTAVDVVFFNAAIIRFAEPLKAPVEELEQDFKITNLALYVVAQWAVPKLQQHAKDSPSAKPALIVTNSHLPWDPIPQLLSLSLTKASQANMVKSFHVAFSGSGVHFGLIRVEGIVDPQNKVLNPRTIAEKTWEFYQGGEGLDLHLKEE
ncbi:NAD(P)-binding protein [Westerdykella ornata]|uniref:NAD(P)-binding protein n=1 Tax=Westerdykella ornata TaxID=318751 RepID=A0A6A6JCZ0_WESOR|nr:NAD(P)-binding protein [Westerdykella ornata]KAF2273868.1 NAD(P)-binding protein [Westerdykella ornata]